MKTASLESSDWLFYHWGGSGVSGIETPCSKYAFSSFASISALI